MKQQVSPLIAIVAVVVVLAAVAGTWMFMEKRQAAEIEKSGNRSENMKKALQDPERLKELRALSQGSKSGSTQ